MIRNLVKMKLQLFQPQYLSEVEDCYIAVILSLGSKHLPLVTQPTAIWALQLSEDPGNPAFIESTSWLLKVKFLRQATGPVGNILIAINATIYFHAYVAIA